MADGAGEEEAVNKDEDTGGIWEGADGEQVEELGGIEG